VDSIASIGYYTSMNQLRSTSGKKRIVGITLDPALVARLDAWRETQRVRLVGGYEVGPPSRSAAVAMAISAFLSRQDSHRSAIATGETPGE